MRLIEAALVSTACCSNAKSPEGAEEWTFTRGLGLSRRREYIRLLAVPLAERELSITAGTLDHPFSDMEGWALTTMQVAGMVDQLRNRVYHFADMYRSLIARLHNLEFLYTSQPAPPFTTSGPNSPSVWPLPFGDDFS
jgi:hypothetical protein